MIRRFPRVVALAAPAIVAGLLASATARADALTNGGFETGDFSGWNVSGLYACVGTSVACVQAFGLDSDPGPHSGSYAAYLGGSGGPGNGDDLLSQGLTDTAGAGYYVSFYLAAPAYQGLSIPNTMNVQWNGTTIGAIADLSSSAYLHYSFWVRGGGADTLSFATDNLNSAYVLDDVSVTSAPEPAALGLLLVGMTAVGFAAYRRGQQR